jgi:hypothetical protein
VVYAGPEPDCVFEDAGEPEFGKGEVAGYECANCGAEFDPDNVTAERVSVPRRDP